MATINKKYKYCAIPRSMIYVLNPLALKIYSILFYEWTYENFKNEKSIMQNIEINIGEICLKSSLRVELVKNTVMSLLSKEVIIGEINDDTISFSINMDLVYELNNKSLEEIQEYFEEQTLKRIENDEIKEKLTLKLKDNPHYPLFKSKAFLELASRSEEDAMKILKLRESYLKEAVPDEPTEMSKTQKEIYQALRTKRRKIEEISLVN